MTTAGESAGRLAAVSAALAEHAPEHDRAASYLADGIAAVHAAGLLTATVGTRYGRPRRRPGRHRGHPARPRPGRPVGRPDHPNDPARARTAGPRTELAG